MVFQLLVMLFISLQPKVYQFNYISFGFVMMTFCVVWEGQIGNMHLIGQSCLPYGICKQWQISFKLWWWHYIRGWFLTFREAKMSPYQLSWRWQFYTHEPAFHMCPLEISLVTVLLPMFICHKIHHLDMFKLSILIENKWEVGQTLEATLLIPLNIPPLRYGWIYSLLLGPPYNHK